MEKKLKEQIVNSATAVKRKLEMIKDVKNANNMALDTIFKSITDPLQKLANRNNENKLDPEPVSQINLNTRSHNSYSSNVDLDSDQNFDRSTTLEDDSDNETLTVKPSDKCNISEDSFKSLQSSPCTNNQSLSWSLSSEVVKDVPFGVKSERGKLILGKTRVIDGDYILRIGNQCLKKTPGLMELLFKKTPQLNLITKEDLQNYKLLLMDTNAHRRNCDPTKPINSNKGFKYKYIIKPLFKLTTNVSASTESPSTGKGIELLKKVKKNTEFVYWDDPNELVERLQLLIASRDAGNTGLDNEIIAIIEELYEAGLVDKI